MTLEDVRRRLPVVSALPKSQGRGFVPGKGDNASTPKLAVWEFTLACDQHCIHCGPRAGQRRPDELSTDEALALVRDLAQLGVGEVVLIGGEAYLRNDFILVIREIRRLGMTATMTTGGYNLSLARAHAMVEAGIQSVSISIDGLQTSHDRVRNTADSWEHAFAALRNLRAAGAKVAANTQINVWTRNELPALLELLHAEGIHAWQLQITVPHGHAADHPEMILQPYMYGELFETLERVVDRCEQLGITFWPANSLGYFGPYEHKLRRRQRPRTGHYSGCEAGASTMGIEANGAIKNCPSLGTEVNIGGSWREHGVAKLWRQARAMTALRNRTVEDLWGYCRTCYYAALCMGGCTAVAEPVLGRPGNNPFCIHRALDLQTQGLRERIELVREAPPIGFGTPLFRVIREPLDPEQRATQGPVAIEEPRVSRLEAWEGPGWPVGSDSGRPVGSDSGRPVGSEPTTSA
jgi:radical SAM protein with 4Fe4S-binding SPASM domain